MEPNQNQQAPIANEPTQPVQPESTGEKRSLGPVIGIVVVVILLILGAFYVWGGKLTTQSDATPVDSALTAPEATPSDEVSSIESELEAAGDIEIDLSGLDSLE